MLKLLGQRLVLGFLTLIVVSALIFAVTEILPGDVATAILGQSATPETVAAFNKELGLDRPAIVRYVEWMRGAFAMAISAPRRPSSGRSRQLIAPRLYNTFFLAIFAAVIAVPLALFLGIMAALYRNSSFDRIVNSVTLTPSRCRNSSSPMC